MLTYQLFISSISGPFSASICILLFCIWLYGKGYRKECDIVFFSVCVAMVTTFGLKYILEIPRPVFALVIENDARFPSGHATMAAVVMSLVVYYSMLHVRNKFLRWVCCVFGVLWFCAVVYSRLYLGVHVPIDVVAGGLIGIVSTYGVVVVFRHLRYYR